MTIDIKNLHKSKIFHGILIGIGSLIIILVVFQAGMIVGFHKAAFSYKFGDSYYKSFGRPSNGPGMGFGVGGIMMRGADQDDLPGGHGAFGKVIKINLPSIIVADNANVEKIITITDDTNIRKFRDTIKAADIAIDDGIIVIGSPDEKGQIIAKLIRVLPPMNPATTTIIIVASSTTSTK